MRTKKYTAATYEKKKQPKQPGDTSEEGKGANTSIE
jgi:hypothetical protein